jgi:hypothetical protein
MAEQIPTMSISDWEGLIRKTFMDAWSARSAVDSSDFLYRLEDHFFLRKIAEQLISRPALEAGYKRRLPELIGIFSDALLESSDDAKQITGHHILQAKHKLIAVSCPEVVI